MVSGLCPKEETEDKEVIDMKCDKIFFVLHSDTLSFFTEKHGVILFNKKSVNLRNTIGIFVKYFLQI